MPSLRRGATWWREVLLIAAIYGVYELSRGVGDVDISSAFANGRAVLHLERVWHIAPERVLNEALEHATFLAVFASYFYSVMHYLVTPGVLIWMYRKHRAQYGPARTALAASTLLGLLGFILMPTAPPRMLRASGVQDTLAHTQHWGWWGGEGSVPRGLGGLTNQFAAMPSLHVGWSIWCGVLIAVFASRRWVKALGVLYPITTTVVVMATGNHYLLDAVAGAVTMALGALITALVLRRWPAARLTTDRSTLDGVLATQAITAVRAAAASSDAQLRAFTGREVHVSAEPSDPELCRLRH
jgi:hypothetical protein